MKTVTALLVWWVAVCTAFVPSTPPSFVRTWKKDSTTTLYEMEQIIRGVGEGEKTIDVMMGGVGLAMESALKMYGPIRRKKRGKAETDVDDLIRYFNVQSVDEATVESVLAKVGGKVVASAQGTEIYADPGKGTTKEVQYAPDDAVNLLLPSIGSSLQDDGCRKVVINFLGSDDLQVLEVMLASEKLVDNAAVARKASISFNSVCHKSFPLESVTMTVVAFYGDEPEEGESFSGIEKSVALGEVFEREGKYWTVSEDDINTAEE